MLLSNTFSDPDDVAAFLLLQLQIRIKDTEVKLLHESVHVQFDLELSEKLFKNPAKL